MNKIPSQILNEIKNMFLVFLYRVRISHIIINLLVIWPRQENNKYR